MVREDSPAGEQEDLVDLEVPIDEELFAAEDLDEEFLNIDIQDVELEPDALD